MYGKKSYIQHFREIFFIFLQFFLQLSRSQIVKK